MLFDICVSMLASLGEATFVSLFPITHSSISLSQTEQTHREATWVQSGSWGKETLGWQKIIWNFIDLWGKIVPEQQDIIGQKQMYNK